MLKQNKHLEPGDVVAIPFGPGLSHYGLVTSSRTVISNSRKHGGVVEQSLEDFANGKRIRLCERSDTLGAVAAETRARRALGKPYSLTGSNCAHLARSVHRRNPTSIQIARAATHALGDLILGVKRR